jgi:hypothetical protein
MKKMELHPLPERISITLYGCRGGDKSNEGWFFLNPSEWEKFKVQLACSTESRRSEQAQTWHDIEVFSPDDFDSATRDLRRQKYVGGCMMEPL